MKKYLFFIFIFIFVGCVSVFKGRRIDKNIYQIEKRLVDLEQNLKTKDSSYTKKRNFTTKQLAAVNNKLEHMQVEIDKLNGQVDELKIAVKTGSLPGASPDEDSIAKTLNDITTRLDSLELSQSNLVNILEKKSSKSKKRKKSKRTQLRTVSGFKKAFKRKQYLYIIEDAPKILKRIKKKSNRQEVMYLYAESLYKMGRLREAALKYNDFVESKPQKSYLPKAKLRIGDCFRHLGDAATAKLYYEEILNNYPKSSEAKSAKDHLDVFKKKEASNKKNKKELKYSKNKHRKKYSRKIRRHRKEKKQ